MSEQQKQSLRKVLIPLFVFLAAFGLRLIGICWGLPNEQRHQSLHPDEEVIFRVSQQIQPLKGEFKAHFYNYGTLYPSLLRIASDMTAAYGGGVDENKPWEYVGRCHLAGRLISAAAGAGAAVLVFLMLRRRGPMVGALMGAAAAAFAPGLVVHSRFQTVDMVAVFLLVCGFFFAARAVSEDARKFDWVWAGAFIGLSAGTKYTGALGFVAVAGLWLLQSPRPPAKSLALSALAASAAFAASTPGILLESDAFKRDFAYEMAHTASGHGLLFEHTSGWALTLLNFFEAMGLPALLVALCGIVLLRRERALWPWLAFGLLHFVLIGKAGVSFLRYVLPLVPVMSLYVGALSGFLHEKGGKARLVVGLIMLALGFSARNSAAYSEQMAAPDPRDYVALSLKEKSGADDVVGLASDPWFWSPSLFPDSAISRMPMDGKPGAVYGLEQMALATKPKVVRYVPAPPEARKDWDVRLLNEVKPKWVVFSNFEVGPVARLSSFSDLSPGAQSAVEQFKAFHTALEADYEPKTPLAPGKTLAERYQPSWLLVEDMAYVRPIVYVWQRKQP